MKYFILSGLICLLSACHSYDRSAAFKEQVNNLQLNFKKPYQPAGGWLTDSIRSSRAKQWYAMVEQKWRVNND